MADFLERLLSKVAKKVNWKNFKISDDVNFENGNGFLGEFFLTNIINEDSGEKLELAVKKAFTIESRRQELCIPTAFKNEIHFYEKIIPALMKFKDERKVEEVVDFFVKFYMSSEDEMEECLVMENLKNSGFCIIGRENFLDEDHVEFIFRTYGKFHALSFAFKDQKPEEYQILKDGLYDFLDFLDESQGFQTSMKTSCESAFQCLDQTIQDSCRDYVENTRKVFTESYGYKGEYSCIVHGDCWSNNMMFKYQDSKLSQIKLIDFQLAKENSPVHDLSYFLYAGATKETYQNIDKYLKIYHESFSTFCQNLGSDPKKLYPFEALKEDWRKYCKWGLMMGLMLNRLKLMEEDTVQGMVGEDFFNNLSDGKIDDKKLNLYRQRIRDLLEDVYKKGFLTK